MIEPALAKDLFKGRHFDQEIIVLCVRWYLTFKLHCLGPQHHSSMGATVRPRF
jgi:hypothetical protein